MKKLIFISILFFLYSTVPSLAQKNTSKKDTLVWYTDLNQVQEISKSTNKPIFAFFTGSDWCGWCHRLQKNVFAKPQFKEWAQKNVVLLELDFPRKKQLPAQLSKQNNELQQVFQVQGFPVIWMFFLAEDKAANKMNISALGSLGYPQGAEPGKEEVKFLSNANGILANGKGK